MPTIVVRNALKINNLPELACFESFEDLLKALPDYYSVEIPQSITNVEIGPTAPDNLSALWIKYDNSGSFTGLFLFTGAAWNQIYPAPNEVVWMTGDSTDLPPGYQLTSDDASLTAPLKAWLETFWFLDPTSTFYIYFSVTRTSF